MPTDIPAGPASPTVAEPQTTATLSQPNASAGITVLQVSSGTGDKLYPAISGNRIVWIDNDTLSVQLYNTSSGNTTTISNATSVPFALPHQLAIAETYAAWSGINLRTGGSTIYLYDAASGTLTKVTGDSPGVHQDPGVTGDYIVWTNRTVGSGDVWLYEIASGTAVPMATGPSFQVDTEIGGNTTVWADNGTAGGDFDIVVASIGGSGGAVLANPSDDHRPDVSSDGQHVAWIGFAGNGSAVYVHDVAANNTSQITGATARPDSVAVDGDLVVYSDLRSGNHDIFVYDITTSMESPIVQDQFEQTYPDISNGTIGWMGNNTGQWEIYRASVGG
jgi:beta propeller repeat protein